jgi:hypothetical protein
MFDTIKELAPVIVHVGEEEIHQFVEECYNAGVYWHSDAFGSYKLRALETVDNFIDDIGENVCLTFYIHNGSMHFLVDDPDGNEAECCRDLYDLDVVEYEEIKRKENTFDLSDFETILLYTP